MEAGKLSYKLGHVVLILFVVFSVCSPNAGTNGFEVLLDEAQVQGEHHIQGGHGDDEFHVTVSGQIKNKDEHNKREGSYHGGIHLVSWRWSEFSSAIMFSGMIISAVILKIIFHHLTWLAKALPESCVLIVIGVLSGTIIHYVILDDIMQVEENTNHPFPQFTATLFFNVLLPPIILDSALSLYDQAFFHNFITVVVFAVFGTLFNTFAIGYSLYSLSYYGVLGTFSVNTMGVEETKVLAPTECLIFSSLISAVDPVAVLAIFEDIHVNIGLYFLVFGESLFNDGVTVVLYNTMIALINIQNIGGNEIMMALLSFVFVVLGGSFIGFVNGVLASYVTCFTKHVRVVEPLLIFSSAYLSFLEAELLHWSGIISIIAFGITMKRYGFQNISKKSYTTVKYSIKTLASTSDCIIFIFLGLELIQESHNVHWGFISATIILCLIFRFISTFLFAFLVNLARRDRIEYKEQFIMAYGGLRGAVGFSLAVVLEKNVWYRELFVTTALSMVFFTVFLQGGTIKLFVKLFKIKLATKENPKICDDVQNILMEDVMHGVRDVIGRQKATGLFSELCRSFDKFLKSILIDQDSQQVLQRKIEKICLEEHMTHLYAPRIIANQETTANTQESKHTYNLAKSRKSFRKGRRASNWQSYKTKSFADPSYVNQKNMIKMLEARKRYSHAMKSKVLSEWIDIDKDPVASSDKLKSLQKSHLINHYNSAERASKNAHLIKAQYDKVQGKKRSNLATLHQNNIITEEEEMLLVDQGQ